MANTIQISRWINIDSEEARDIQEGYSFLKQVVKIGLESDFYKIDNLGRLFVKNTGDPVHSQLVGSNRLVGIRIAKRAAN